MGVASAQSLKVGLYPYVPRIEQFKTALIEAWQEVSDIPLDFSATCNSDFSNSPCWDGGYSQENSPDRFNLDVFVFDALFFDEYKSAGQLTPMSAGEIEGRDDFVDYAKEGVKVGETYYAIPQLGCANILFYDASDYELASATNLTDIESALGTCTYTSEIPPDRRGLTINMSGGTTNAALYLDTVHSLNGTYPFPLPWDELELDPEAIDNMRELLTMASYENATDSEKPKIGSYERAEWFSNGWGRATIGYTESMSVMSQGTRDNLDFKVMPLSRVDESYPAVFYADVIAVNPNTQNRDLAVQLANVMAASDTIVNSFKAEGGEPPQYLMATRPSVFDALGLEDPIYDKMFALVEDNDPIMFKLNSDSREWLDAMKGTIQEAAREDYVCGCDYSAIQPIFNNTDAPLICNETCSPYGGWNGQWTNDYPAAREGSVCGCHTCAVN
ncbi:MAG: thiamine pyridinylase [Cyanobacteria bacterium SBLK]|nr:thiamine pyridinylase [Cyanobacteria bacterium SBLK]